MAQPLYPLRSKPQKKPEAKNKLWKNPYILGTVAIIIVMSGMFFNHLRSRRNVINPDSAPTRASAEESRGLFSFMNRSRHFQSEAANIESRNRLARFGIATDTDALSIAPKVADLREQRRAEAIQKHLAAREDADRHTRRREEHLARLSTPFARQLETAVTSLNTSDRLGIMQLERILEERSNQPGITEDADAIIMGYTSLAEAYVERNMPEQARAAYINAFRIIKQQAPAEQRPEWQKSITAIEEARAEPRGH